MGNGPTEAVAAPVARASAIPACVGNCQCHIFVPPMAAWPGAVGRSLGDWPEPQPGPSVNLEIILLSMRSCLHETILIRNVTYKIIIVLRHELTDRYKFISVCDFTGEKVRIVVFLIMKPCSLIRDYICFGGTSPSEHRGNILLRNVYIHQNTRVIIQMSQCEER